MTTGHLTKGFLMAQQTGAYLVSNCCESASGQFVATFDECVAEHGARSQQWDRIKAAGAAGGRCFAFHGAEHAGCSAAAKLTRRFLMSLATGVRIVSNAFVPPFGEPVPVFEESIVPCNEREAQWKRIKAAQAVGRTCHVFESAEGIPKVASNGW